MAKFHRVVAPDGMKQLLGYLVNESPTPDALRDWVETWLDTWAPRATAEASAKGEAGRGWVPVAEWPEEAGCVAIGYDVFYGRIGEVERRPGSTRWVFIDSQKDDCDVVKVQPLPPPPKVEP